MMHKKNQKLPIPLTSDLAFKLFFKRNPRLLALSFGVFSHPSAPFQN